MSKWVPDCFEHYLCTQNKYYDYGIIKPTRLMIHSTGCNNPNMSRWASAKGWNNKNARNSVHGIIAKNTDGTIEFVQLLPFNKKAAGCGKGSKGSYNGSAIQVEIAEDDLKDKDYFTKCYNKAVEVFAKLCILYDISYKKVTCHADAHKEGYASNHGDVNHWFPKYGKSMDTFRNDIKKKIEKLKESDTEDTAEETKEEQFKVKITCDSLNVRKGAGTNYEIVTEVKKGEVYTIVKVKGNWGELKSGVGYINISEKYVERK